MNPHKTISFLIIFLMYCSLTFGQKADVYIHGKDTTIVENGFGYKSRVQYTKVDSLAKFQGDPEQFILSKSGSSIAATLPKTRIIFLVKADGNTDKVKVISDASPDIKNSIIAIVRNMPKWTPGYRDGKPVNSYQILKIK